MLLLLVASVHWIFRSEYKDSGDSPYNFRCDKDYYNDLPGKVPPDLLCDNELPHGGASGAAGASVASHSAGPLMQLNIRVREDYFVDCLNWL